MHLERVSFEGKEALITMDSLKEANSELTAELDEVKQQLLDVRISARETSAALDEKEKKKADRMAQMMAGFDVGNDVVSENEGVIRRCIETVDRLHDTSAAGEVVVPDDLQDLRNRLSEAQGIVRQADISIHATTESGTGRDRRTDELKDRLASIEREYEELLERNLSKADVEEVKSRLEDSYANRREAQIGRAEDLQEEMARQVEDNQRLRTSLENLQRLHSTANGTPSTPNSKLIQQQMADFDVMKKSLMRDLQNRCERVVELEISLDETREQYNNVLRSSNNKAQQKKMAFLERNLEQLTHVQRQLVEQNGSLKKEVAIAERKLKARNERIMSLEELLQDSQEKLTATNHR